MKQKKNTGRLFVLFLTPAVIVFLVFMVWPICYNVYLSFYNWNMVSPVKQFVGFRNYTSLLTDRAFLQSLSNTGIYVLFLMVTCFAFPYFISFAMTHLIKRGQSVYRSLLFFPSLVSLAVASTVFTWIFNVLSGPVAEIYRMLGMESPNWFSTSGYVILVLSIITTWKTFGYNLIVFLAAVVEVPVELIEAARLEKASKMTIFRRIIIPLTSSTAFYVFIITFVFGLQYVFTPIHMITKGGPNNASTNIVYVIYQYAFGFFQSGKAAAVAVVTVIVFFALVFVYKRLEKKVHYEN
ncbi:MAG: sugar ABC transporter permease [Clostridia bacterium]|nr:sugar ABC transporter permease [Clostridia bacterium]